MSLSYVSIFRNSVYSSLHLYFSICFTSKAALKISLSFCVMQIYIFIYYIILYIKKKKTKTKTKKRNKSKRNQVLLCTHITIIIIVHVFLNKNSTAYTTVLVGCDCWSVGRSVGSWRCQYGLDASLGLLSCTFSLLLPTWYEFIVCMAACALYALSYDTNPT